MAPRTYVSRESLTSLQTQYNICKAHSFIHLQYSITSIFYKVFPRSTDPQSSSSINLSPSSNTPPKMLDKCIQEPGTLNIDVRNIDYLNHKFSYECKVCKIVYEAHG
ncbi:uncharacterized protein LOC124359800 [Homalodisca vitripennis]|uniref:uncharacterized protein LOC124359800 n=1 Tax=Homalodisca vitripennis TaxID=197043 RepID=UPI001EEC9EB0|nr:uncharacterized protein LOC124359800 [Homalodisca vitripennis]XP_046668798.1 uncharacterized protein LOC124359800 [Homalodisca vitripennis]